MVPQTKKEVYRAIAWYNYRLRGICRNQQCRTCLSFSLAEMDHMSINSIHSAICLYLSLNLMLTWARMLVQVTIGLGLVEMVISTHPKHMQYRSLYENTGIEISQKYTHVKIIFYFAVPWIRSRLVSLSWMENGTYRTRELSGRRWSCRAVLTSDTLRWSSQSSWTGKSHLVNQTCANGLSFVMDLLSLARLPMCLYVDYCNWSWTSWA